VEPDPTDAGALHQMLESPGQISRLHNRAYGRCEDKARLLP